MPAPSPRGYSTPSRRRRRCRPELVTEVEVDGCESWCIVCGSFQPFLEALRGYEVMGLTSTPAFSVGGARMSSTGSNALRRAGFAAMLSGMLYLGIQVIHPA